MLTINKIKMYEFISKHKTVLIVISATLVSALVIYLLLQPEDTQVEVDEIPGSSQSVSEEESNDIEDDELIPVKQSDAEDAEENQILPQISSWSISDNQLSVRGFVDNVIEDGGNCNYVLFDQNGSQVATATSTGISDATTTNCPSVVFSIDGLSKTAQVQLNYSSETGSADGVKVEVSL